MATKVTREHSLTRLRDKPFLKRGDSGAFVMDIDGKRILLLIVAVDVAQILAPSSSLVVGIIKLIKERHTVQARGTLACGKAITPWKTSCPIDDPRVLAVEIDI